MDLIQIDPILNLYDQHWPIHLPAALPTARVRPHRPRSPRRRVPIRSSVRGAIISGGQVFREHHLPGRPASTVMPMVEDSIIFDDVDVGRHAKISPRAIIDKDVRIPPASRSAGIGGPTAPQGLTVTDEGVTIVAKSEDPRAVRRDQGRPGAAVARGLIAKDLRARRRYG